MGVLYVYVIFKHYCIYIYIYYNVHIYIYIHYIDKRTQPTVCRCFGKHPSHDSFSTCNFVANCDFSAQ